MTRLFFVALALGWVGGCAFEDKPGSVAPDALLRDLAQPDAGTDVAAPDVAAPDWIRVDAARDYNQAPDRQPVNVHLTWQRDPATTVTVQWGTLDVTVEGYEPRVWYARADELEGAVGEETMPFGDARWRAGMGFQYTALLTKDDLYVQWEVELTGLEPGTDYVYRAGTWGELDTASGTLTDATLTPLRRFRTGLSKGSRAPQRVMVAGDSRGGYDKILLHVDRLAGMDADYWLFSGDMNQIGKPDEWRSWFGAMNLVTDNTVLMPVQGNHETLAELYYNQFALPREEAPLPAEYVEHAWHLVNGNVLLIGLDSNVAFVGEAQVPWLQGTLARYEDDPDIDWRIVMFHHPAYSASSAHGSTAHVQENWVPIFETYGVDLVFAGHDHNYERTAPIRGQQVVAEGQGVTYVVCGAFFAPGYSNGTDWWTRVSHHGDKANYALMEIEGKTLSLTAYSGDGSETLDTHVMRK